ncbi:family Taurine catabolism dioxygenase protein [Rutstroemia sp. NJR-2017a BBW]|nr:family Taurine catabolism dioxygenase protein [Rutstroemia sp. NJR-2017a BBW]
MAPSIAEAITNTAEQIHEKVVPQKPIVEGQQKESSDSVAQGNHREPLRLSGALDKFESFDVTPIIGREFVDVNLADWIKAPNSDELLRDLAITISQRGVVFFRKQDDITNDIQKELVQRLGELSGKPATSKLHIHPISNSGREHGDKDDEISVISSAQARKIYKGDFPSLSDQITNRQSGKEGWHSDITFEPIPSDYALLRLTQLPKTGGDTLWASGYEVYGEPLYFPSWKSIFALGHHVSHINDISSLESSSLLKFFLRLVVDNQDLQVRHRWQNVNDLAIWDNRSNYHIATPDYIDDPSLGERSGQRAVSLGEKPYFDPLSTGRREALGLGPGGSFET